MMMMMIMIMIMMKVLDAHDQLKTMVRYYAVTEATSADTQWQMVSNSLFNMLKNSVKLSGDLHRQMNDVYSFYVDYLVTDVISTIHRADDLYAQVTTTFITVSDDGDSQQIDSLVEQLKSVQEKLNDFDENLEKTVRYSSQLFPKRLLVLCNAIKQSLDSALGTQLAWLEGFPSESQFVEVEFLRDASEVRLRLAQTADCMEQYKVDLGNFCEWLDAVQPPQFASSLLPTSQMDALDADGAKLRTILRSFVDGSLTKGELARQYLTKVDKLMETNVDRLVTDVKQSVFNKLDGNIDKFQEFLGSFFRELFAMYVNLQKSMDSNDQAVKKVARKHEIWRKPAVNFQSSEVRFGSTRFHTVARNTSIMDTRCNNKIMFYL